MRHFFLILVSVLIYFSGITQVTDNNFINHKVIDDRYDLNIYPNPVRNNIVTLEVSNDEITEIKLINIGGKEVVHKEINLGTQKYQLTLYEIPNGIYFLRIETINNNIFVKKLVVSSN